MRRPDCDCSSTATASRADRERLLDQVVQVVVADAHTQAVEGAVTPTKHGPDPAVGDAWRIASSDRVLGRRRTLLEALVD